MRLHGQRVTTAEVEGLRRAGVVKGRWVIESEEEPSSDVQVRP